MRVRAHRVRQRGSSEYLIVLTVLILAGMFVVSTITSSTTALTTEAARLGAERARWNAYSGAIEAEKAAEAEVPQALVGLLAEAQQSGVVDWSAPVLAGLQFPELRYQFDFSSRPGCAAGDRAEVTGTLRVAGPPEQLTRAGVPGGGEALHFEHYTILLDLISTGHSASGARQYARQNGAFYVDVETVPGLTDPSSVGSGGIGGGPIIDVSARTWPRSLAGSRRSTLVDFTPGDLVLQPIGDTFTLSGGATPSGGWTGAPEIVPQGASQYLRLGNAAGNRPYVFYLKGLPVGTTLENPLTGTILAIDSWRFSATYNAGADTYEPADGGAPRYGTPRYAVVVVWAPDAAHYYPSSSDRHERPRAVLRLPDGTSKLLEVNSEDESWRPGTGRVSSGEAEYDVAGAPAGISPTESEYAVFAQVNWGAGNARPLVTREIPLGPPDEWEITVDGHRQDLTATLFGGGGSSTGQVSIVLGTVGVTRADLEISYNGASTTVPNQSRHTLFGPDGTTGDPVDPPPPCCDPPPPARARRWIIAYKTGTIKFPSAPPARVLGGIGSDAK